MRQTFFRIGFLGLALILIVHGIFGPQFAPKNLSTLFIWVHYRGLLVIAVLLLGNFFCYACPLVMVRDWGRLLVSPRFEWPSWLKNKWLSIAFFVGALFLYEQFDLWSSPRLTAFLILAFFAGILIVDLLFTKASFCKYVCPIGQFNFMAAMVSPVEVAVWDTKICDDCESLACIKGTPSQRGCELKLFVPRKAGNFDCTFCMDCQSACPHGNVVLKKNLAGATLWNPEIETTRAGIGRLWERWDVVALIVVFTFGALLNAFGMVGPAYKFQLWVLFLGFLVLGPLVLIASALWLSRRMAKLTPPLSVFLAALIPLGMGIWTAHYSFHFLSGALTFLPVLWSQLGLPYVDPGFWASIPMGVPVKVILPMQMGILLMGLVGAVMVLHKRTVTFDQNHALGMAAPWYVLILLLSVFAAWVFSLPMEMRGTFVG